MGVDVMVEILIGILVILILVLNQADPVFGHTEPEGAFHLSI